ncbi:unnamed protein product [Cuscuta epithymum]|uniref:AMP-activated protein kinase glycogen-binding domain-containing protein n=1 Tax=Cuscuta epithymum TaxID=186058 RepID=A0AAV0GGF8_9ASTE|nr:unnamed protein product [Cuscuta epithymum]
MVSHIAVPNLYIPFPQLNTPYVPSLGFVCRPLLNVCCPPKPKTLSVEAAKAMGVFGILQRKRRSEGFDRCCCSTELVSDGDGELEARILEFMEKSENSKAFPTRKELEKAERFDLVDAIRDRGGWFVLGWDSGNEGHVVENESETLDIDFEIQKLLSRMRGSQESAHFPHKEIESAMFEDNNVGSTAFDYSSQSAPHPAYSSLEIIETESDRSDGIEGILSRLEKERNSSLGINIGKYKKGDHASSMDEPNNQNNSFATVSAAEVDFSHNREDERRVSIDSVDPPAQIAVYGLHGQSGNNNNSIRTRLQHLEIALSSALQLLSSKSDENAPREATESSPSDLQKLSDALEFQENELMDSQEILRSLRANLAVVEGKMGLAIIDTQKVVEAKQKRINGAHKALQILRDVHIIWPSAASEVLLTGSFDSWATQRKMDKSSTGIFSVCLKLYPGRYEIKFIVDGEWRIDPLRPTTQNHGHENNLLMIT